MRRLKSLSLLVLLILVAVFALSGCAKIAEKATEAAVEKATGVKVDSDKQTITTTDEEGNKVSLSAQEGKYPDAFPSDFPQYPGGTVDSALNSEKDGKQSFTVIVKTADPTKDVYAWYLAELEKSDWKIDQKMDSTTSDAAFATVTAVKGDQRAGITMSRANDETETSIMIGLGPDTQ